MLGLLLKTLAQLKPVTKTLLLYEELDVLTTLSGLTFFPEIVETNPLPGLMGGMLPVFFLKIIATIMIVIILERVKSWPRSYLHCPLDCCLACFLEHPGHRHPGYSLVFNLCTY